MLRPFSFRAYCRQEDDFKEADMLQNVLGSDGQMHVENQVGNMRIGLTTGETKTVVREPVV